MTPKEPKKTEGLEGDLILNIGDACIERSLEEINDLFDPRGEAGGEDVPA